MNWKQWFRVLAQDKRVSSGEFNAAQEKDMKEKSQVDKIVKYQHPKILLVDVEQSVGPALKQRGYNVAIGSLGTPYRVPVNKAQFPVFSKPVLPFDYKEHEIVVIDLHYKAKAEPARLEEVKVAEEVNTWWVSHEHGLVNPRILTGYQLREDFDRILDTGGVFVIFANSLEVETFQWGHFYGHMFVAQGRSENISNWDMLSLTSDRNISIGGDHGSTIALSEDISRLKILSRILLQHLDGVSYDCTIGLKYSRDKNTWMTLLKNKFGDSVGSVFLPDENRNGYIFIFPNILNKTSFVLDFIHELLPEVVPGLYPETDKNSWTESPEYQLTQVTRVKEQIVEIQKKRDSEIASLQESMIQEQAKYAHLYHLVTETGDALVVAVHSTLKTLGFSDVINVDDEIAHQGMQGRNREDLRIHDTERTLIMEVKGITYLPTDEDALTVQKYVVLRMREWSSTSIQGLTIINSQRHLPPLDRNNQMPFRQEILDAAEEQSIGLMTGWDLHRLARSYIENRWSHENVRDLFFKSGRIQPIPDHYKYIGTIERYIESKGVVGIHVAISPLKLGERIAFELPTVFEEQICDSLQHENFDIRVAQPGTLVGVKTHLTREKAKAGTRVFKVHSHNNSGVAERNDA